MIKDRGGDFSRGQTTLVCMGGCCCCCCLQSVVAAYCFGKAASQTAAECLGKMGFIARALTFIFPLVGSMALVMYCMDKSGTGGLGGTALALVFFSPIILSAFGALAWVGSALGTFVDSLASDTSGIDRLDNLELFGRIISTAALKSIGYAIPAFLVSIPVLVLFISPIAWTVMPVLIIAAAGVGWSSANE